ncbi:MAG TPA: type II secretion system protein E, partial [Clostridiales bacterium]|nr:type II secretion system protein E [Clostridiales bacterium]
GSRKITSISEVIGMEGDIITLQDIFTFRQEGIDGVGRIKGNFEPTGIQPHLLDKLKNNGISVKSEWFVRH